MLTINKEFPQLAIYSQCILSRWESVSDLYCPFEWPNSLNQVWIRLQLTANPNFYPILLSRQLSDKMGYLGKSHIYIYIHMHAPAFTNQITYLPHYIRVIVCVLLVQSHQYYCIILLSKQKVPKHIYHMYIFHSCTHLLY